MSNIKTCPDCRDYTLKDECQKCGAGVVSPHPPRFSPEDRYGKYRRKLKKITKEGA